MDPPDDKKIIGYHGCDADSVPTIQADNFRCSIGDDHWLGEGAYFFAEGFSNPTEDAKEWAIAQSWDKQTGTRKYSKFSVVSARIFPGNPLDMTKDEGKAKVNEARKMISKRLKPRQSYDDNSIIRWLATEFGFDVLIQDFYIKMSKERRLRIQSRYPNVRVICVRDPNSAIDKATISVTYTALIPSHSL